jgi:hypothetical protein
MIIDLTLETERARESVSWHYFKAADKNKLEFSSGYGLRYVRQAIRKNRAGSSDSLAETGWKIYRTNNREGLTDLVL